jgi:hypothetical protein
MVTYLKGIKQISSTMKHFKVRYRCQENPKRYANQTVIKQRTPLMAQKNGLSRVLVFPN